MHPNIFAKGNPNILGNQKVSAISFSNYSNLAEIMTI